MFIDAVEDEVESNATTLALSDAKKAIANLRLPSSIALEDSDFISLYGRHRELAFRTLDSLKEAHGEKFGGVMANALSVCCFRLIHDSAYMARMIEFGVFPDCDETRTLCTPGGYGDVEGLAWALASSMGIDGVQKVDSDTLSCMGLFWLREAASAITNGDIKSAMDWLYEGQDALGLAASFDTVDDINDGEISARSADGRNAADVLHSMPGGSREKRDRIRALWATGKYQSRDLCADQESAALDMSPSTARKHLRNTPQPPSRCDA